MDVEWIALERKKAVMYIHKVKDYLFGFGKVQDSRVRTKARVKQNKTDRHSGCETHRIAVSEQSLAPRLNASQRR